ncbi:ATP-binding cassette domain-containing protein [Hydrogenibacillus schlegelii]|uniref:ABC transporter domain-containing protein n=1 Tax=Hydrogenibacillus schlegelii TaxID=1484 RepID=A0A132ND98_HYDSH|nr:ATP-binding cassette domain-containing protein [Hydrogenibacillus schlegelii]KWX08020.1 hypothetical protein TR75_01510 [Hydrogenibacillus schlegelii]OAR04426.1 hypothetical protein SA87_02115 [Hydrogenibacillus schlegelii]
MTGGTPPLLRLEGVTVRYRPDGPPALAEIDLTLRAGEWVSVLGANGSGKSTLARVLAGLIAPTAGAVILRGAPVGATETGLWPLRQAVGLVLQNPEDQIVAATVEDDVAFGPENRALPPDEIERRVTAALRRTGLEALRSVEPARLSGGEKQRLAVAGALAVEPAALVFDEATSMLDAEARARLLAVMREEQAAGRAIVHITHELEEAEVASRLVVLDRGRLRYDGPPAPFFTALAEGRLALPGLLPPFGVRLAQDLTARGIAVRPARFDPEAVVEAAWTSASKG